MMNRLATFPAATILLLVTVLGCGTGQRQPTVDLDAVLSVTTDSLAQMDAATPAPDGFDGGYGVDAAAPVERDEAATSGLLAELAELLERNYNAAVPALFDGNIAVAAQQDASILALADTNANGVADQGERALWKIEVDGDNARILATDSSGAVDQAGFSGTGLFAGYLLGSMLSRQRAAGVNTQALSSKRTVSPAQAARARAGSGSFSRGK